MRELASLGFGARGCDACGGFWLDGLLGTRQRVLIENKEKGHSDGFAPVAIQGSSRGDLGTALVTARDGDALIGIFE